MARLGIGVHAESAEFRRAAVAFRILADKGLTNALRRGLRDVAKPLGEDMIRGGAAAMPHRGGLSARVAASTVGQRNVLAGGNVGVELLLRQRQGYRLDQMDAGKLRHPVFERGHMAQTVMHRGKKRRMQGPRLQRRWVQQAVPAKSFTTPFEQGAPKVRAALVREISKAVDEAMGGL